MAAGVTLRKERIADFRAFMEARLADAVARARHVDELLIDGAVSARGLNPDFVHSLNRAGPFGSGNPEPMLALPSHLLASVEEFGQAHLRLRLKSGDGAWINAVAFRSVGHKLGHALIAHRGETVHIAGCASIDRWQGVERVQFRVSDVAMPDPGPAVIR